MTGISNVSASINSAEDIQRHTPSLSAKSACALTILNIGEKAALDHKNNGLPLSSSAEKAIQDAIKTPVGKKTNSLLEIDRCLLYRCMTPPAHFMRNSPSDKHETSFEDFGINSGEMRFMEYADYLTKLAEEVKKGNDCAITEWLQFCCLWQDTRPLLAFLSRFFSNLLLSEEQKQKFLDEAIQFAQSRKNDIIVNALAKAGAKMPSLSGFNKKISLTPMQICIKQEAQALKTSMLSTYKWKSQSFLSKTILPRAPLYKSPWNISHLIGIKPKDFVIQLSMASTDQDHINTLIYWRTSLINFKSESDALTFLESFWADDSWFTLDICYFFDMEAFNVCLSRDYVSICTKLLFRRSNLLVTAMGRSAYAFAGMCWEPAHVLMSTHSISPALWWLCEKNGIDLSLRPEGDEIEVSYRCALAKYSWQGKNAQAKLGVFSNCSAVDQFFNMMHSFFVDEKGMSSLYGKLLFLRAMWPTHEIDERAIEAFTNGDSEKLEELLIECIKRGALNLAAIILWRQGCWKPVKLSEQELFQLIEASPYAPSLKLLYEGFRVA